jgi:hypothetical protein
MTSSEKRNTRIKTNKAISAGEIIKTPCEVCGDEKVECHHMNYEDHLDVKWLCRKHHYELHGKKIRHYTPNMKRHIVISVPESLQKELKEYHKARYAHMSYSAMFVDITIREMKKKLIKEKK